MLRPHGHPERHMYDSSEEKQGDKAAMGAKVFLENYDA